MSKTHSKPAKALSMFLCALMVLSTVCFFNPIPALKANATVDVTKTLSAKESNDVTFNVPESIYLKPGSSNFQYFLTNNVNSNGATALSAATTSMTVSASSPYAENMKLTYSIESTGKKADGSSVAVSGKIQKNGADIADVQSKNSVSIALNSSNSFSGYSDELQGSEAFIKWILTYTVKGVEHTIYAYTSLYVPYLGQAGMSAHSRHTGTYANPENWTYSFLTGGHSVTGGAFSSKFTSNKAVKKDATGASNAVFVAPLVEFSGNNAGNKRADTDYPFNNGGTIPWGSNFYIDAFNAQSNGGVAIKSNSTSADDYYPCNDNDLGSMKITVDTSRFPNYNQIPNLSVGWAQFRHDWDGGDNYLYWISGLNGTTTSGMSQSGLTGATITTNADTSRYEGYSSLAKGLYSLNGAVTDGDHLMVFCYRNSYAPYVGNQSKVRTFAGVNLNVKTTDKASLRETVFSVLYRGYSKDMSATYGAEFENAMLRASKVLADQFATASDISSAAEKLDAVLAKCKAEMIASLNDGRESVNIYAVVPETIYLKPSTSSMTSFEYYLNNTLSDGNIKPISSTPATTGSFIFECKAATKVRIIVSNSDVSSFNVTVGGTAVNLAGSLSSATAGKEFTLTDGKITGTITGGTMKAAVAQNTTKSIEWKFIYTLEDGTTNEYVSTYTVAYAPYLTPIASGAQMRNKKSVGGTTYSRAGSVLWVTGIQSICDGTAYGYAEYDASQRIGTNIGTALAGVSCDTSSDTNVTANPAYVSNNGVYAYSYEDEGGGSSSGKIRNSTSPYGYLRYDSSRFVNLNQIPDFKIGFSVVHSQKAEAGNWSVSDCTANGVSATGRGEGGTSFSIYGTLLYGKSWTASSYTYSSTASDYSKGIKVNNQSWNRALEKTSSRFTVSVRGLYVNTSKNGKDSYKAPTATQCNVILEPVDKTLLREAVQNAIKPGYQDDWMKSYNSTTYEQLLKTACEVLGNPAATQGEVDSSKNNLNNVARDDNRISATAKATHRALVKTVSENGTVSGYNKVADIYLDKAATVKATNESKTYEGSDNVMISANDYAGYTYMGYKRSGATSFPNGSYDSTNKSETYLRVGKSLASSGKDNLVFFYEAPDANLSIDLNGGDYPVDKLNTEINATTGSTFDIKSPTKAGYTFAGWKLDGAGKLSGNTYTFGLGDGKLTAQWTPVPTESAELIIDPNGGTMNDNELLFIEHGAQTSTGGNDASLSYNIAKNGNVFDISGKYTQPAFGKSNEQTIITTLRVYLEAGKSYTFKYTDDNELTEFYLFKDGDSAVRANFAAGAAGEHSYTFKVGEKNGTSGDTTWTTDTSSTGWYYLRLDQNKAAAGEDEAPVTGTYSVKNMSITSNGDAKLGYKQAAETEVYVDEPVRDGYKFAGWSGLVNGTLTRIDADETNVNGGYVYTFKGKADTLVAQWTVADYEIGFDNLFYANDWTESSFTSAKEDAVSYDKANDTITYTNNKTDGSTASQGSRRAESNYRVTGLTPGKEYIFSYDFASNMTGGSANDCNTYVFIHFYDENGAQINLKNTDINYGMQGEYVGKYVINFTDAAGNAQSQVTPSEWAWGDTVVFSGLQVADVVTKDGYGHSDIIFTAPAGTVSMDVMFGAQHNGQTASFKNIQLNEFDRVNPITDYTSVRKSYNKDAAVFGELASAKRVGYDFKGWFTGKNGTGTQITASTSTAPYHTRFTAWSNWEEINYTVSYNVNGGTLAGGTVNPTKYTINTEKITVAAAPSKQGYIFKGWKITKDTSVHADNNWTEETVAAGKEYTDRMYGDVTLTAVWEENASTVKVTVREQNADGTYTDTVIINGKRLDGDVVDLAAQIGAKTGFKAVSISNNGKAFALNNGKFTVVGGNTYDIVITRDREQYTFTVKYVMSDGSTAPETVTKTLYYGQSGSVTSPGITGYTADKKVATVDAISQNTTVTVTYTLDKHNVTVYYKYDNGTTAAETKTVTVEYGKSYSVESPKIEGYTADQAVIKGTMGTSDVSYTVTYKINSHKLTITYVYAENEHPASTKEYTLKYGDKYSYPVPAVEGFTSSVSSVEGTMGDGDVNVTVTYTIITFTVSFKDWDDKLLKTETVKWNQNATAPAAPAREGYTFKGWDKAFTNIKANTEVKALYDINTYTLSFDANGGSAVGDIKQAYATAVTAPVTSRTGYTFVKWTGDDGSDFPSIMPAKNIKFTASWTANKYTIAFDANNGTGTTASVNATYDANAVLTANGFSRTGYTFAGWNTAANGSGTAYADKATVKNLASDNGATVTLYAQWTANDYTVTYRVDGKEIGKQTYKFGAAITAIANPTKEGYTFKGWKEALPAVMPANDITVDAVFEVNTYKLIYTVDGTEYKSFEVKFGEAVTAIAEPVKTGYTFSGWNGVPATMPAHDVTVTGTFTVNSYKLTFMSDGKVYDEKTYEFGAAVAAPEAPSKTGYSFAGWDKTVPATMPAEDTVITAKWTVNSYTVTFDTDGGTDVASVTQAYGTAITAPTAPTKTGYTFAGWTPALPETMPAENITVKAQWSINSYTLTVKYVYENGAEASATHTETVEFNGAYTVESPAITGYTPDSAAVTGTMGAADKEITVTYKANAYTATFDPDNGTDVIEKGFSYGEKVVAPEDPTKTGYTFAGWTPALPETMPAENLSFKATWTANGDTKVTVKHYTEKLDGGYDVETVVAGGTTGELFTATAKSIEGFTFNADASVVSGTVAADGSLVLELYYTRNTYTVTYYVDGAEHSSDSYKYGAAVTMAAAPAKTGYTFSGWDNALTAMPANDVTVNGTFTANTYYVEFNANGGNGSMAKQEFAYDETKALTANAFTRTGYTFAGWSTVSNGVGGYSYTDGETVKNLCTANGASYVVYAQWTANTHTVTFKPENGEADVTKTVAFDSVIGLPSEPVKNGYTFEGWFNGDEKLTADTVLKVDGDVTYTARWSAKGDTPYTVKYLLEKLDGGYDETVESKTGATDATAEAEKKVFTGFTLDEKSSVVSGVITADGKLTLTLKYTRNTYKLTYKSDGTTVAEIPYKYGAPVESVDAPAKTGYTFAGWDKLPEAMPATDTTVNAKWNVNSYTITFDTDGGTAIAPITQDYGTAVAAPAAPTKTGYVFAGWSMEIPATMPAENITVKAQWTPATDTLVTVKHYLEKLDGTYELKETVTDAATTGEIYTATAKEYEGFTFDTESVITGTVAADGSLVLTLNYTRNVYTLTFMYVDYANGIEVKYGAEISYPSSATKEGYTFIGWDTDLKTMPAHDLIATALFAANEYSVAFDSNGGIGAMDKQSFVYDIAQKLTKNTFTKADSVFVGWNTASDGTGTSFADEAEVKNLTTAADVDVVLYAQWKDDINHNGKPDDEETPWRVSYVAGEGGALNGVEGERVLDGMKPASVPEAKANTGYAFRFWSVDGTTKVEPKNTVITKDTTFTALFGVDKNNNGIADEDEGKVTVTYDMNGTRKTEHVLVGLAPAAVPSKDEANEYKPEGKCFKAWDGDVTAAITADTVFTAIYADDLNGDEIPDEEQKHYTVKYLPGDHGSLSGTTEITVVENMPYDKAWEPTVTPEKYFIFDAWNYTPEKITGDTVITAIYGEDKNKDGINDDGQDKVEITFAPGEFGELNGESIILVVKGAYSETVAIPTVTPDADHIFKAWSPVIPEQFNENATYTATYAEDKNHNGKDDETEDKFTVKFVDYDGKLLSEQTVLVGMSATAPAAPTREYDNDYHYSFAGWDKSFENVTADITVTAMYTAEAHSYGEWKEIKAATCTEDGEKEHTCTVCGETATEKLPANGHTEVKILSKPATCTEDGWTEGIACSVCLDLIKAPETIPALGHDMGYWEVTKDSYCYKHGEETRVCRREGCEYRETREAELAPHTPGEAVIENRVDATCETAGSYDEVVYCEVEKCHAELSRVHKTIDAIGHDWDDGVVTTPATCETDGVKTFTCKHDASHTYTEVIPADGHENAASVIENKVDATCETDGSYDEVVYCSKCNKELSRDHKTIDAIGHDWDDGVVTTPATCETDGVKTFTCKHDASHTYTEVIPATGHAYGEWTVKTPATCTAEGEEIRVCANDETHVETRVIPKEKHTEVVTPGKEATCTEPGYTDYIVCSECGTVLSEVTEIPALGHNWGEWKVTVKPTYTSTGVAMRECARCGKIEEKELPAYDHENDYLEILAPDVIHAGSEVDIKAIRLPAETIEEDAVWSTSDDSVLTIYGGKFYALSEGKVTLTATSADGKLVATKEITVLGVDYDNARIIKFINMNKMHYIVAGFYKVYSDGAIYWSRESECPIEVYAYSNFNYPTYIVYFDGKAVEADENGVYHIPAGTKNVVVSIAGATKDDPEKPGDGSGTGTKVSFWELIVRFFRKLFSIFKKK